MEQNNENKDSGKSTCVLTKHDKYNPSYRRMRCFDKAVDKVLAFEQEDEEDEYYSDDNECIGHKLKLFRAMKETGTTNFSFVTMKKNFSDAVNQAFRRSNPKERKRKSRSSSNTNDAILNSHSNRSQTISPSSNNNNDASSSSNPSLLSSSNNASSSSSTNSNTSNPSHNANQHHTPTSSSYTPSSNSNSFINPSHPTTISLCSTTSSSLSSDTFNPSHNAVNQHHTPASSSHPVVCNSVGGWVLQSYGLVVLVIVIICNMQMRY